jgi:hypothetical protein
VQNTPPTIGGFTVRGTRAGQPANFADVGETINVGVTVTDPETAITNLVFIGRLGRAPSPAPARRSHGPRLRQR